MPFQEVGGGDLSTVRLRMYCLQWLIPVLLIPKPVNPALLYNHVMLMVLYLTGFFLERKPCTICTVVFIVAAGLIYASSWDSCSGLNWEEHQDCQGSEAGESLAH